MSTTKVVTGKVRFSYAHVFKATSIDENSDPKYSVSLLIPKKDKATLGKIEKAIKAALVEGKSSKFGGKLPTNYKNPLRDGDDERPDSEEYEGMMFINASSKRRPGVVDENRDEILDEEGFKSGDFGRASVNFYPFSVSGNKGIACGLNHVQKLEDGDALGGSISSAQDDFADEDDEMM